MPHDHVHMEPKEGDRRVAIAIWANGLLTVAQIVGGILSGSLALIADAIHNFSDMASLVIAFGARKIARRPADAKMTFGYGRVEIVAALINYTSLIIIGLYLVYEGAMRFANPVPIEGWTVVILGGVALFIDTLTAILTYSMQKGSVNIRALFLHNLSDALASVAVIVGGVLILLYDVRWVDPAITIGIAAYILWLAFTEIGGPIRTLMLGSPPDMDTDAVITAIEDIDGVEELHHAHFWQMQEHQAALDTHVVIEDARWDDLERIKEDIKTRLEEAFDISHSTLEFERARDKHEETMRYGHG
ncbi:MAG: cation diffusion facilitator family transporter [Sulfitobacter sp.]|jgi:cobalt-zinc-cadmium efflux system protein|nr:MULTISPECIES: cation diffusion facilitator family transporter [Sulfitobacter]MAJ79130.1 cation transporter [Roseobacter sp.]AXI52964.1 cation transporter [Sulfitobacter sp. SK025]KZX95415.1 cation diffusion facilitator family transporter [Sulfitobacter sp. HI0021]KZY03321.1 cation diffusion facilitator family transporter [Sulfitobacter sp. HI0027]KZZ01039.1 cation diffusion facilitator family transporter [Sulfitobacter sp. HI0076]